MRARALAGHDEPTKDMELWRSTNESLRCIPGTFLTGQPLSSALLSPPRAPDGAALARAISLIRSRAAVGCWLPGRCYEGAVRRCGQPAQRDERT